MQPEQIQTILKYLSRVTLQAAEINEFTKMYSELEKGLEKDKDGDGPKKN